MATPRQIRRRGRFALVTAVLVGALVAAAVAFGAVTTSQSDYSPGSVVTISGDNSNGAGYVPASSVDVAVSGGVGWTGSCSATVSDDGSWSCQVTLSSDESVAVGNYTYTATSTDANGNPISEAGTFTDAASANANFATTGLPANTSVTVHYSGTNNGNNPVSGDVTFNSPGPSSGVGFLQGSSVDCTFPASVTVGANIYNLTNTPCPITVNSGSSPIPAVTATGTYSLAAPSNVAPVIAWTGHPATADEGDTKTYSFSITDSDSSSWSFASGYPDCGTGGTVSGTPSIDGTAKTGTFDCLFPDGPANPTVKAKVTDGTDLSNELTQAVTVNNVAPSGTFDTPSSHVNEGSSFNLDIGSVTDPSTADTNAGFTYAFDCGDGSGYSSFASSSSVTCNSAVDGPATLNVGGKVQDKDGGISTYTGTVTVDNVKPTPAIDSLTGNSGVACINGNMATLGFSWTDPAQTYDTYNYDVNWGDNGHTQSTGFPAANLVYGDSPVSGLTHSYAAGTYTIGVTLNDSDTGAGNTASSSSFSFLYNTSGILQPINPGPPTSIFKYGSTIPVKIKVTDCNGTPVSGLTLNVGVKKVSGNPPAGVDETVTSTSAADSGTTMRYTGSPDNQYIYNLATKSLCDDPTATYTITITGTGIPPAGATFGLKK